MAEKKYLDSEKVIKLLRKDLICKVPPSFSYGLFVAADEIAKMDGENVRPVVRCRDCVHFQQFRPHDGFCKIDGMLWNNDFFCANGAKREES